MCFCQAIKHSVVIGCRMVGSSGNDITVKCLWACEPNLICWQSALCAAWPSLQHYSEQGSLQLLSQCTACRGAVCIPSHSLSAVALCRPRAEYATGKFSWRANTSVPTGTVAMKPSLPQSRAAEDDASTPAALPRPRASVWQQRPPRATPPPLVRPPVWPVLFH